MVDIVLPIVDIPQKLIELWANTARYRGATIWSGTTRCSRRVGEHIVSPAERALHSILMTLHTRTGHDFHHYKRATVLRRIERRLQVNALPSLPLYERFLSSHPEETSPLLKDMLIGRYQLFP